MHCVITYDYKLFLDGDALILRGAASLVKAALCLISSVLLYSAIFFVYCLSFDLFIDAMPVAGCTILCNLDTVFSNVCACNCFRPNSLLLSI